MHSGSKMSIAEMQNTLDILLASFVSFCVRLFTIIQKHFVVISRHSSPDDFFMRKYNITKLSWSTDNAAAQNSLEVEKESQNTHDTLWKHTYSNI